MPDGVRTVTKQKTKAQPLPTPLPIPFYLQRLKKKTNLFALVPQLNHM